MNNTLHKSRATIARITSVFLLAISAPSLTACTVESSGPALAAERPTPGAIEVVQPLALADRARVPEKEPGFVSAEVKPHGIVIAHDGRLHSFAAGDVLGGTQGGGYLVRVVQARARGSTHFELETTPAHITEFITEGHFRVHYDAKEYEHSIDQHLAHLCEVGDDGVEPIASQAEALKLEPGAPLKLVDISAASLPDSCGTGVGGTAELDATVELSPVLDLEVKIGPRGGINPLPELKQFRLVMSGRLDVNAALRGSGTVTGECTVDLLGLTGNVLGSPLPTLPRVTHVREGDSASNGMMPRFQGPCQWVLFGEQGWVYSRERRSGDVVNVIGRFKAAPSAIGQEQMTHNDVRAPALTKHLRRAAASDRPARDDARPR